MFHTLSLSAGACPIFVASSECKIGLVYHLAVERIYVMTYHGHATNDVIRFPRPSPSAFAYNEARITWITENGSQKETIMVIAR